MTRPSDDTMLAVGRVLVACQILRDVTDDAIGGSAELAVALCELQLVMLIESDLRPGEAERLCGRLALELANGLADSTNGIITAETAEAIVQRTAMLQELGPA